MNAPVFTPQIKVINTLLPGGKMADKPVFTPQIKVINTIRGAQATLPILYLPLKLR